tara:strand:- start:945 stop:1211 length:267 start_codon:yes stop_codon:yes gene_type:complete
MISLEHLDLVEVISGMPVAALGEDGLVHPLILMKVVDLVVLTLVVVAVEEDLMILEIFLPRQTLEEVAVAAPEVEIEMVEMVHLVLLS